jgi:tetratricopeptide (TPR) repeat protein
MGRSDRRQRDLRESDAQFELELERGRKAAERRAWGEAYDLLARADARAPLAVDDLELLAMAAYLLGRDEDYLKTLERAHRGLLDASENTRAARCAFWLGLRLMFRGEIGPATGWIGRARRLVECEPHDCVEQGYLLLPLVQQHLMSGDWGAAHAAARHATEIGRRFRDTDLVACALHLQGRALLRQQDVERGLALLDESMVAVTAGELSPIVTGLVYCSVIEACQQVYALSRAGDWTDALAQWCGAQPEMVAFTGRCLVHRSEIMLLRGAWDEAVEEARRACSRISEKGDRQTAAAACYQEGEVHRLRGDYAAAEAAYRNASQWGWEPQPGFALLRFAQGRVDAAAAAIRRAAGAAKDPLQRVKLLPACIEIMLASRNLDAARSACRDLEDIAARYGTDALRALAARACGLVQLADGGAQEAVESLQAARRAFDALDAPYLAATTRVDAAIACRALGDEEGAGLELDAARTVFERLGALPELARIDTLPENGGTDQSHEKTVDRHVSNILSKLHVPSRAGATAYAYEHNMI